MEKAKATENSANAESKIGYADMVKASIIDSLKNGTSVLQEDRKGLGYIYNGESLALYSGVSQLYLNQERKDKGLTSPFVMTTLQFRKKGFIPKDGEKSSVISYYTSNMRYHQDEYPLVNGVPDKSQAPIHKKNEWKLDSKGQPVKGYEYNQVFFGDQIDETKEIGSDGRSRDRKEFAPKANNLNNNVELKPPYPDCKAGAFYKAKDGSTMEIFAEKVSEFFNSCFAPDASYEKANFSKKQIAELEAEFNSPNSTFFQTINDSYFMATGQNAKLEKIQERRQEIENFRQNSGRDSR
jgi:hypothetical protein